MRKSAGDVDVLKENPENVKTRPSRLDDEIG